MTGIGSRQQLSADAESLPTVFVVDDDPAVRESLRWLLEPTGLAVETFADARQFLADYDPSKPGCLILDIRLPDVDGMQVQQILAERGIALPIIIVTAYAEVATAVRALKAGAVDFIEKPFNGQELLEHVRQAIKLDRERRRTALQRAEAAELLAGLTPREQQVLALMLDGKNTKTIAAELGLSSKTIDVHRAHIMLKMRVDSMIELSRLGTLLDLNPQP